MALTLVGAPIARRGRNREMDSGRRQDYRSTRALSTAMRVHAGTVRPGRNMKSEPVDFGGL